MKVISYSAWRRPEVHTVHGRREAKRLCLKLKHFEQKQTSVYTEKQYRDMDGITAGEVVWGSKI